MPSGQTFKDVPPVHYRLTREGGVQVLEAECRAGASGWLWRETVELRRTPALAWRWKVGELPGSASEREKAGDDFAARVYVVLDGGWAPWRTRSLVYVWARHEPAGTDWPSAYTAQAHIVALFRRCAGRTLAGGAPRPARGLPPLFRA